MAVSFAGAGPRCNSAIVRANPSQGFGDVICMSRSSRLAHWISVSSTWSARFPWFIASSPARSRIFLDLDRLGVFALFSLFLTY
jgi:hypothetical protein